MQPKKLSSFAAKLFYKHLREDIFYKKYVNFSLNKPEKTKSKKRNPTIGKRDVEWIFDPEVKLLKRIIMPTLSQDFLGGLDGWYFDEESREAVMTDFEGNVLLRIFDPIHLLCLSDSDLKLLDSKQIVAMWNEKSFGFIFAHVVRICVEEGYNSKNLPLVKEDKQV